ncbi:FAD-binding domain-containing protein [Corynespora cassiicola Philippines]|uniref:FAD-binding domain-containing protein n=1 Tax=Corynespora cassiicola Philippines TaxID=1448308 RepID=A0A2T2NHH1_CORCC|nr:FAD-binding domain-containing protein [Corynespora cassiicola Philippines]
MRFPYEFALCALYVGASVQSEFEPKDFNVTNALIENGIDVAAIPDLAGLLERSAANACSIACGSLKSIFGNTSVIVQETPAYENFTKSYWSAQQTSLDPYCIFKPSKALDVSTVILISRLTQCPFAVKSGGHAAFGGASSIEGGITIALEKMNEVTLSTDKKQVALGPGNLWGEVYTKLESEDLAVIGGRVASIGVGGLTLGGGISFFSNKHGWACDNVISFEVVTASGVVITASQTSSPDLYWALRGGGNNFGIVTKFLVEAIPQGPIWGGGRTHLENEFSALIDAYYNLGKNAAQDTNAGQILSFAYAQGTRIASADITYAKPISNASIFAEYNSIPNAIADTRRVRSLADLTLQFDSLNPRGLREMYWAASFKLDRDLTTFIKDIFFEEVLVIADAKNLVPAATLQVITEPILARMARNGGNPLGLSTSSGPLILLNLNTMWSENTDDARILQTNLNIINRAVAEAEKRGLANSYIYMNYASQYQAVVPSYGTRNQQKLKTVAKKYDPMGIFENLQPGYFKLDGATSLPAMTR